MKLEEKKLPKGWEVKKLGEVGKCITGNTPSKNDLKNYGEYLPFVKPPQLQDNKISDAPEKLSKKGVELARVLPLNSVLITCIGNLGRTALNKVQVATNQQINAIIPKKEIIEGDFLFYQAQSSVFKNQLEDFSSATTVAIVNKSKFETIKIAVPPLPEQQVIVAKIEELFSELENGKKELLTAQAKLKTYRQSLLKWAFEGRLTNENLKDGELPKGWEVKKLGEVAKNKSKKVTPADYPDAKFVGMDCIEPHTLKPKFTYKFGDFKSAGNYFEMGQVLYGRMRPYLNKVYKAEYEGACSGEFIVLQCSEKLYPNLLSYILHSKDFVSYANHKTNGDRPRISYEEISDYPIALGPLHEQQAIVAILESKLTICDKIEETITASLKQVETLRQTILKKAFEGKLINKKNVT